MPAIGGQRCSIGTERAFDHLLDLHRLVRLAVDVLHGDKKRRITQETELAIDNRCQLVPGSQPILGFRLDDGASKVLDCFRSRLRTPPFHDCWNVEAGVPGIELRCSSEQPHHLPVGANALQHHITQGSLGISQLSSGDLQTGRKPLHIPLERADGGFVEIIDVEDQITLGRRKATEVRQVRVAAQLDIESGVRQWWTSPRPSVGRLPGKRRTPSPPCGRVGSVPAQARVSSLDQQGGSTDPTCVHSHSSLPGVPWGLVGEPSSPDQHAVLGSAAETLPLGVTFMTGSLRSRRAHRYCHRGIGHRRSVSRPRHAERAPTLSLSSGSSFGSRAASGLSTQRFGLLGLELRLGDDPLVPKLRQLRDFIR